MGETEVPMSQTQTDDTRRSFLQLLATTGVTTAAVGSLSNTASATTTDSQTMDAPDLVADGLVPANKYLTLSFSDLTSEQIESLDVLVDGKPTSTVQMYSNEDGSATAIVSVFDLLTNHDLKQGQSLPIVASGETSEGKSFSAETLTNVVDPTGVLGDGKTDGVVAETTTEITDTVDSTGVVSSPSAKAYSQQSY